MVVYLQFWAQLLRLFSYRAYIVDPILRWRRVVILLHGIRPSLVDECTQKTPEIALAENTTSVTNMAWNWVSECGVHLTRHLSSHWTSNISTATSFASPLPRFWIHSLDFRSDPSLLANTCPFQSPNRFRWRAIYFSQTQWRMWLFAKWFWVPQPKGRRRSICWSINLCHKCIHGAKNSRGYLIWHCRSLDL